MLEQWACTPGTFYEGNMQAGFGKTDQTKFELKLEIFEIYYAISNNCWISRLLRHVLLINSCPQASCISCTSLLQWVITHNYSQNNVIYWAPYIFTDQASTANIYTHEFNIACMPCMLQKGCYSAKIKSVKTFLMVILWNFIPLKYTRYTVYKV